MTTKMLLAGVCLGTGLLIGCGSEEPAAAAEEPLRPAESFDWSGQPISFSLPPEGWERQRAQNGGREGVRFIKAGSVGEEVRVEERFSVSNRDRCARLRELAEGLEKMDRREFDKKLQRARLYAEPPLNREEGWLTDSANERLDEARTAYRAGQLFEARTAIDQAAQQAARIRYSLDDVVEQAIYRGEGYPPYVKVEVGEPGPAEVAGEPAIRLDYHLTESRRNYSGREFYVVKNNHLFVVAFQGLKENLPMFERFLETVSFPEGECRH